MSIGHISIRGEIVNDQSEMASLFGFISLSNVLSQIQSQSNSDEYKVHVHSVGGSVTEGFAIYEALKATGKKITTINEGIAHSISSIIMMAGSSRQTYRTSTMVVHNESGEVQGSADDLEVAAKVYRQYRDKIINIYIENGVKLKHDEIQAIMDKGLPMSSDEAKEYGFITEVLENQKAVAKFTSNIVNSNDNKKQKMSKKENDFLSNLKGLLGIADKEVKKEVKNIKVSTAELGELDFYELEKGATPSVGDKARFESKDAQGDVLLQDGTTYVFEKGELTEIKEKEVEAEAENEAETLKARIAELEGQLTNSKEELVTNKKELETVNETITNLKNLVSKNVVTTVNTEVKKEPTKKEGFDFSETFKTIKNKQKK